MRNRRWIRGSTLAAALLALGTLAAGTARAEQKLLEERDSTYNNIYVYQDGQYISLTFGHNKRFYTETVYDTKNEFLLPVTYTRFMTVALAYAAKTSSLLEIGFGGGRTTWYLHKHMPALDVKSVELDPAVYDLAKKYFGIKPEPKFSVEVADGRSYMLRANEKWDMIMIDAYRGPFVPFHLLTKEFFQLTKTKLNPGGVVVQNVEPTTMLFESAMATIKSVFANVDVYDAGGNIVAVAYDGAPKSQAALNERAAQLQKDYRFTHDLTQLIGGRRVLNKQLPGGKVLSDDFAPVESMLAIERHNKKLSDISQEPPK